MKKLLGILVLGLLWSNVGLSKDKHDFLKKNVGISSKDTTIKGWKFRPEGSTSKLVKKGKIKYVYAVTSKDEGPVRWGETAQRFELRADCTDEDGSDCDRGDGSSYNRVEISATDDTSFKNKQNSWITWSLYLPKNDGLLVRKKTGLGQFHSNAGPMPSMWEFKFFPSKYGSKGLLLLNSTGGGISATNDACGGSSTDPSKMSGKFKGMFCEKEYRDFWLMDTKSFMNLRGKWTDFLVNVKWDDKQLDEGGEGYFKLWINGKLYVNWKGQTIHKNPAKYKNYRATFKYGLYSRITPATGYLIKDVKKEPQFVYYDEVWKAKSCKKLKLDRLGYSCEDLESQKAKKTKPDRVENSGF